MTERTRPITSLTFEAGEPAWSVALGRLGEATFYLLALFLWWATGSWRVGAMGLLASACLTPLPLLYLARRCLARRR